MVTEPIVGYKVVRYRELSDERWVESVYRTYRYTRGINKAHCYLYDEGQCDGPPRVHHASYSNDIPITLGCGFHSTPDPLSVLIWAAYHSSRFNYCELALLRVANSDKVIEGSLGYMSSETTPTGVVDLDHLLSQRNLWEYMRQYWYFRVESLKKIRNRHGSKDHWAAELLGVPLIKVNFSDIDNPPVPAGERPDEYLKIPASVRRFSRHDPRKARWREQCSS